MENIKMSEIYMGLEKQLQTYEVACKQAEERIDELMAKAEEAEALMNKYREEAEKVEADNKVMFINVAALKKGMAALQEGSFATPEDIKEEKAEAVKKESLLNAKVKPTKAWVKRKGEIGQFKSDGTFMNSWTSQKSAAIGLQWDASSVCRFMKLKHDTQVRKKGFYLEYMG